jgi:purine-binding chemotaxis protein CheW
MTVTAHKATLVPDPSSDTGASAVLAVVAGGEVYGFPLSSVREILIPPPIAEVPRAPDPVIGVIAVRGQIVTLVDLPRMLSLEAEQAGWYGRVLLVDNGEELIGVAVDRVVQVYRLEQSQIEYASTMGAELSEYVIGVGRIPSNEDSGGEELLILIDPVSLLRG